MLKTRVITAAVLVPLLVIGLYHLSTWELGWVLGVLFLLGAWEWAALSGLSTLLHRALYLLLLSACGIALLAFPQLLFPTIFASVIWWLSAFYMLTRYAGRAAERPPSMSYKLISGIFVLVPTWLALLYLHAQDPDTPAALLYLFVLIWVADSAAYFTGRACGRHKLSPRISPGKSVEGLAGGLVGAGGLALVVGTITWEYSYYTLMAWVLLCLVVVLFSVLGDLFESMVKREAGVKESGKLLPGHGGILDRSDSMTAAAPVYTLGWWLFGQMS